jgi:hypothetical protein
VFATYDAMAIALLSPAALVASRQPRMIEPSLLLIALLVTIADVTKYAAGLWDPIVIALVAVAAQQRGLKIALARAARTALYTGALLCFALFGLGGRAYEHGVSSTTTARSSIGNSASEVLGSAFEQVGPILVLALLGTVIAAVSHRKLLPLCVVATIALLLAPANQARIGTETSLHKHVVFGALFAAVAAGYTLGQLHATAASTRTRTMIAAVAVAPIAMMGLGVSGDYYSYWPNATGYITALEPIMSNPALPRDYSFDGQGYDVVAYYLPHFVKPDDFEYQYWSTASFTAAVKDRKLAAVLLDWAGLDRAQDQINQQILTASGSYHLAYDGTWNDQGKQLPIQVWALSAAKTAVAGAAS